MKARWIGCWIFPAWMLGVCAWGASEFYLTHVGTGERVGPFAYTNGVLIEVSGQVWVLTRPESQAAMETEKRLRTIIIPRVEFRQAAVSDVMRFLRDAVEASSPGSAPTSIVLSHLSVPAGPIDLTAWDTDVWGKAEPPPSPPPGVRHITLDLRRVSLYDAFTIICEVAELSFHIDDEGKVVVEEKPRSD